MKQQSTRRAALHVVVALAILLGLGLPAGARAAPQAAVVYVDDSWIGTPAGVDPDGAGPATSFGTDAFATIQAGVDAVDPGGVVRIFPGVYSETAGGRTLYDGSGPYQFGVFIGQARSGVTLQGVDAANNPIGSAAAVAATVNTNATNGFGPSGIFVEGDQVTIAGLRVGVNSAGQNKTIEVIGDNFTLRHCDIADPDGSVYFNDWRFDTGANTSHVQAYRLEGNVLGAGVSLDIASGAGYSGPVSGRVITGNTFQNSAEWATISFSGSDTGVPWFEYAVGGAIITGNTFNNTTTGVGQHIRARGTYDNSQFDWAAYWTGNTFSQAAVVGPNPPGQVQTYSYPNSYGTFNNVRRIGTSPQAELEHGQPGDTVLITAATYTPAGGYVITRPGLTLRFAPGTLLRPASPCFTVSASNTAIIGGICEPSSGSDGVVTGAAIDNLVIQGLEIRNGTGTGDGIHLGHNINGLQIIDNYIHHMGGDAVEYAAGATVGGVHEVQGNLFQNNSGVGINNASGNAYNVEYNSWGDYAGPTGPAGDGVSGSLDVDPWTHVSLGLVSSGSPVADRVAVGALITYMVQLDARETFGGDFNLNFPTANLSVLSITGNGAFQQDNNCALSTPAQANAAGVINFCGYRTTALNGQAQPVYTVVFQGVAAGVAPLTFAAASDTFAMAPPTGASTNIYAAALTDGSVTVFASFVVTGRIDLQGRPNDSGAVMTLTAGANQGYGPYTFTTSDYWGSISLAAAVQDTYGLRVSMPRYLDVTAASGRALVLAANHTLSTLTLLGGDANDNDVIDISDASIIGGQYGSTGSNGDINNDGTVNILDLVLAGGNYLKDSSTAYAGWTP